MISQDMDLRPQQLGQPDNGIVWIMLLLEGPPSGGVHHCVLCGLLEGTDRQ